MGSAAKKDWKKREELVVAREYWELMAIDVFLIRRLLAFELPSVLSVCVKNKFDGEERED